MMRRSLFVFLAVVLVFTSVMWISVEKTNSDLKDDKSELQLKLDILKAEHEANKKSLRETGKALSGVSHKASELEKQNYLRSLHISELERRLRAERTRATVSRSGTRTSVASGVVTDADFWRRLANCECASGQCGGKYIGYFQFSPDTAAKVGIDGSESYEEQRAAAIEWARRIHPNEGTSSGWPVCWWRALRG